LLENGTFHFALTPGKLPINSSTTMRRGIEVVARGGFRSATSSISDYFDRAACENAINEHLKHHRSCTPCLE
jgi:hypothetical protein